jgi:hypothetical protein
MHLKFTSTQFRFTIVFISLILCFGKSLSAQDSTYKTFKPVFAEVSVLYDFPKSYGLSAGISWPISSKIKSYLSVNGNTLTKSKDLFFGLQTGVYRYPLNYTGVLLVPTFGVRHYTNGKFFYETSVGLGMLRTFYDGKVYEVDASGNVVEKALFGRFYATTQLAFAFNLLLQRPGSKTLALQIKPSLWFQYPFDSFIRPHVSIEAGIKYELSSHSTSTTKIIKHIRK